MFKICPICQDFYTFHNNEFGLCDECVDIQYGIEMKKWRKQIKEGVNCCE
jgi:hypothetical protein